MLLAVKCEMWNVKSGMMLAYITSTYRVHHLSASKINKFITIEAHGAPAVSFQTARRHTSDINPIIGSTDRKTDSRASYMDFLFRVLLR